MTITRRLGAAALLALLLSVPVLAQDEQPVHLSVSSEPAEASVFVRYTEGQSAQEKFLGRTKPGEPLELDLGAEGPAEVVIFKNGFVCKVETLQLRAGSSSRLEVRLTKDIKIPRSLTLKDSPSFVHDAQEFDEIYMAVLFNAVRFYVDEKDPRELVESSVTTLVKILNAVRAREKVLRRELPAEARQRYYGDELDLRGYPPLKLTRTPKEEGQLAFTLSAGQVGIKGLTDDSDLDSYLRMLHQIYAFVKHKWDVRNLLSDAVLTRCAVEGLLEALDDEHTHFMTPDDVEKMSFDTQASFGGIGVVVSMRGGQLTVVAPMSGTPGERAGILPGDVIAAIDGKSTERLSMREAVNLMRGEVDSPVELTLRRGDRELTITVLRAKVKIKHTAHNMLGKDVGYLRITSFMHEKLSEIVQSAIVDLKKQGAQGLIIDLRNNPGGLLTQAHRIADLFVPNGLIVSTKTRLLDESRRLSADPKSKKFDLPIVVVINGGSASASEILAGTLQDHKLATIVGSKSFGKGSVQRVLPLEPYRCALALTVATYHLPSGVTPHKRGIKPNVLIELDEEQIRKLAERTNYTEDKNLERDPQLQAALTTLRGKLTD